MTKDQCILATTYLGPVQYYAKLHKYKEAIIEQFESFPKQSFRNRCEIYGANGRLPLSIPLAHTSDTKILTRDIRIDYATPWQAHHWKSIESAYRHSPFFEFYADEFMPFYTRKFEFLLDFNQQLTQLLCSNLDIETTLSLTSDFIKPNTTLLPDYRNHIHPKNSQRTQDPDFEPPVYYQVFAQKLKFEPNLSIIDLLFNEGPVANTYFNS